MKSTRENSGTDIIIEKIVNYTNRSKKLDSDDDIPTLVLPFTKIQKKMSETYSLSEGPIDKIDCTLDFIFEKNRVRAMENTELYISASTTNLEAAKQYIATENAVKHLEIIFKKHQTVDHALYWLRNLGVIFVLIYVGIIIGTYVGTLFLIMNRVPVKEYITNLILETISSFCFLYISIKITGINRLNYNKYQITLKVCLIYIILDVVFIIFSTHNKSIDELVSSIKKKAENDYDREKIWISSSILVVFLSSMIKTAITIAYLGLWGVIALVMKRVKKIKIRSKGKTNCCN